jgi:hypothetical protein
VDFIGRSAFGEDHHAIICLPLVRISSAVLQVVFICRERFEAGNDVE